MNIQITDVRVMKIPVYYGNDL